MEIGRSGHRARLTSVALLCGAALVAPASAAGVLRIGTPDGLGLQTYVLLSERMTRSGSWVRLRVPGRPNGRIGWVQRRALEGFQVVHTEIRRASEAPIPADQAIAAIAEPRSGRDRDRSAASLERVRAVGELSERRKPARPVRSHRRGDMERRGDP